MIDRPFWHVRLEQAWRDKAGREVDFARPRARDTVDAYECKWTPDDFDAAAYPKGNNYLVTPLTGPAYQKRAPGP